MTPAESALSNIPGPMLAWLILGAGAAITVAGVGIGAAVIAVRRWWRGGARQLARVERHAAIDQAARTPVTRAMSLGDLVINRETERYAAHKASAPTEAITHCPWCHNLSPVPYPEDCNCGGRPCGVTWCCAARRQAGRGTA